MDPWQRAQWLLASVTAANRLRLGGGQLFPAQSNAWVATCPPPLPLLRYKEVWPLSWHRLESLCSQLRSFSLPHMELIKIHSMWKTTEAMAAVLLLLVGATMTMTVEAGVIERCNGAVVELVPCEDSIKGKDALTVPTHGCCMALSELLLSPECLCYAATTSQGFDMKQILGLPASCKFHVKPHQACEGIPIPSYDKPPSEELAPSDSTEDISAIGFSDEIREEIKKEFRAHQARLDSLTP